MRQARRATGADAAELVRLRGVMLASVEGQEAPDDGWRQVASETLRARLDEPDPMLVAFVMDRPGRPGALAACAIGAVQYRLAGPGNPTSETGYVFSVATDPDCRRQGYSRSCMTALLGWYRRRGITTIDLRATSEGEPLYRSLGFVPTPEAMRLKLPAADAP
ncbi:MAG: acetyltransferase [Streptosporangiaceae bacterium]|jgi:GNAT superfamily N-acetyltransferase|nr:acetyltransferase [Streptosporangiaceae bacterium]